MKRFFLDQQSSSQSDLFLFSFLFLLFKCDFILVPAKLHGADQSGRRVTKAQEGQTVYGQFSKQFTDRISHQNTQRVNHLLNNYALKNPEVELAEQSTSRPERDTAASRGIRELRFSREKRNSLKGIFSL